MAVTSGTSLPTEPMSQLGNPDHDPFPYHNPPPITHASQVSNFIHIV
jgi:hypothetical protein